MILKKGMLVHNIQFYLTYIFPRWAKNKSSANKTQNEKRKKAELHRLWQTFFIRLFKTFLSVLDKTVQSVPRHLLTAARKWLTKTCPQEKIHQKRTMLSDSPRYTCTWLESGRRGKRKRREPRTSVIKQRREKPLKH